MAIHWMVGVLGDRQNSARWNEVPRDGSTPQATLASSSSNSAGMRKTGDAEGCIEVECVTGTIFDSQNMIGLLRFRKFDHAAGDIAPWCGWHREALSVACKTCGYMPDSKTGFSFTPPIGSETVCGSRCICDGDSLHC